MLIVLNPFYAYAMDLVYINKPEIWYESEDVVHTPYMEIEEYGGVYSYFTDSSNHCFYLHISYNEANMRNDENEVKVLFDVSNSVNRYSFIIDENGIQNFDSTLKSAFNTAVNFSAPSGQGQEIYIGLEFIHKNDKFVNNLVSFSVCVNDKVYDLCSSLPLLFYVEEDSTSKNHSDNTAKQSSSKATAQKSDKTTKFKYIAPEKSGTLSKSSKYKAGYSAYEYEADNDFNEETENYEAEQGIVLPNDVEEKGTLSISSKILFAVAIVLILFGGFLAVYYANKHKKDEALKTEDDNNEPLSE